MPAKWGAAAGSGTGILLNYMLGRWSRGRFEMWGHHWDPGHPYRWRTWLRSKLPWLLINMGVADKGTDCEQVGGAHWWYNQDNESSACYHCAVVRPGRLWDGAA